MSILLVDDNEQVRKVLAFCLQKTNLPLTQASGVEEVRALPSCIFDFVVCDYGLKDGTAKDVYNLVNCTVFLIISGYQVKVWDKDVFFLPKPIDFDTLLDTLDSLRNTVENKPYIP